jgi:hypothetical protein
MYVLSPPSFHKGPSFFASNLDGNVELVGVIFIDVCSPIMLRWCAVLFHEFQKLSFFTHCEEWHSIFKVDAPISFYATGAVEKEVRVIVVGVELNERVCIHVISFVGMKGGAL